MNTPSGLTSDGTNLYISDRSNHRILRYDLATGAFTGWIGRINTSPTGGNAGCAGAATATFTPGWCLGGTAATGTANGNFNLPKGIIADSGNLYVVDSSNHRIQRFTAASGAFTGWIGRVNTSPTGGDTGCAGTAVNAYTPGWCIGGTSKTGTGDGHLSAPTGLWSNGSSIYIADTGNQRVARVAIANGAFSGWMGNIATAVTGGDSGCLVAAVGTMTPGWCQGGTAKAGIGLGMLDAPLYVSGAGVYVYVSDSNNARLMRFPQ
jgi:sugar lactone lactonase YvrE